MNDYDLPHLEKIVQEVLSGLVPDDQIGVERERTFDMFMNRLEGPGDYEVEDFDFILLRRRLGYFAEPITDVGNIEITTWARNRDRAMELADEVHHRIMGAEHSTVDGFMIDYVGVLNGPEETFPPMLDDHVVEKNYEIHTRVRWH